MSSLTHLRLSIIEMLNKNGSWESVSLSKWKSPEDAQMLNTQVKVKADWRHQIQWLD